MMFVRTMKRRRRPHMRWRDKFEEDLNIKEIRNTCGQWSEMNGGRLYWKPRSTTNCGA
jgi:hypothetical protein